MKKFLDGFTLAEVLITLAIIGVVAAVSLPSIVADYHDREAVTRLKKAYTTISTAMSLSMVENGNVNRWDGDGPSVDLSSAARDEARAALGYTVKDGGYYDAGGNKIGLITAWANILNYIQEKCASQNDAVFATYMDSNLQLQETGTGFADSYKTLNKNDAAVDSGLSELLTDGSAFGFKYRTFDCTGTEVCGYVYVDINGEKEPNRVGKDLFRFVVLNNRVIPDQTDDCRLSGAGWGCASYVLKNENLSYPD